MKKVKINHHAFNRTIIPFMIAFLLVLPVQTGNAAPPLKKLNLSGTWSLNNSKSEFGEFGQMWASTKIVVTHKKKDLSLERTSVGQDGQTMTMTETYTIDGVECENVIFGENKKVSTVNLTDDKSGLTIKSTLYLEFDGQEMVIGTVETFSLADDGKTLVIDATSSSDFGEATVKFVYDLQ